MIVYTHRKQTSTERQGYTMYILELTRDFYTNDGTTQLTVDIIKDYATSMYMNESQSTMICEFKNRTQLTKCAAVILAHVSALVTGDVKITGLMQ